MNTLTIGGLLGLIPWWMWLLTLLVTSPIWLGVRIIREDEVGIVIKKLGLKSLPPGHLIALNGEAGYQADTLAPGLHFCLWMFLYQIIKTHVIVIPQGEIGLVLAESGSSIPAGRILGRMVPSDNFQDARQFLLQGGEKGRQLGLLTAGTYRINTALFTVINSHNATRHEMLISQLSVYHVGIDMVGIVTTLDGQSIPAGEIAGPTVGDHNNFQDAQAFLEQGGCRGLQEQVLLSGSWNLNPWFAGVEQVPMVEIPIGHVGVVISFVGKAHEDVSGLDFKHGDLVYVGHKGVWVVPLMPGKHPLNLRVMKVELVPTTNIVLNWANRTEAHHFDSKLNSITVRSHDGFAFNLDVSQIIHVGATDAPKVISRVGSMQNLVDHVLQPIVGNYFRNSAQDYTVLDFLNARSQRQEEASVHIHAALIDYDVQAIDTLIGDIVPPEALMKTQTDRKIAEEEKATYEVQEAAQRKRQELVRETALADIQQQMVASERGVVIAEMKANAAIKAATGDAEALRLHAAAEGDAMRVKAGGESEAIRMTGQAKAEAHYAGVQALGSEAYALLQTVQIIGDRNIRITPDIQAGTSPGNLTEGLIALLMKKEHAQPVS